MQVLLSSPEITCEHCIATIREVVQASGAGTFISGDPETRTFTVDLASGSALDGLSAALTDAGYPLGAVEEKAGAPHPGAHPALNADWRPSAFRIEKTDVGANVNYDCYCGCDAGFALDRAEVDPAPESCCCGNQILVGAGAGDRIGSKLDDASTYRIDRQTVTMPWGQPVEVALAIPIVG